MLISAKTLIFDIETSPAKVYTWGVYDQNIPINHIIDWPYLLCWSAKWLGKKQILSDSLINYPKTFKKNNKNDSKVCLSLWKLLDEADIVIAHNGDRFDIKRMNTFFLKNGMLPPSPYQSIDTLKESRGSFGFISNKLDSLGKELGLGGKVVHSGFKLWRDCMAGDKKAFATMIKYNKRDVELLEELYLTIKPFMKHHPNMALYTPNPDGKCIHCTSINLRKNGRRYTSTGVYQMMQCLDCGKYSKDIKNLSGKVLRKP